MRTLQRSTNFLGTLALTLAIFGASCQQGGVTVTSDNANTNTANANVSPTTNANVASNTPSGVNIETREPDQYSATLVFTAAASGKQQALTLPVDVARDGDNRRYAFNVPALGQVIFLDRTDKRYLILPARKQYAELTPDLLGFDVRSLTPGQMVSMLQKQRGVERVGEEQRDGRTVIKYRYAANAKTNSQAGDVTTESFIYVDKETGLPLHAETSGQSTGNVQGVNSGSIVADMKNIKTSVDPKLFDVPTDYAKLTSEQIKQQASALAALLQVLLNGMNANNASSTTTTTTTTTTASPTPSASASPTPTAR